MSKTIVAVAAQTPQKKVVYIETLTSKDDGNYQVTTTHNPDDAHDFRSEENAQRIIARLFNPWDRKYEPLVMEVNRTGIESSQFDLQ